SYVGGTEFDVPQGHALVSGGGGGGTDATVPVAVADIAQEDVIAGVTTQQHEQASTMDEFGLYDQTSSMYSYTSVTKPSAQSKKMQPPVTSGYVGRETPSAPPRAVQDDALGADVEEVDIRDPTLLQSAMGVLGAVVGAPASSAASHTVPGTGEVPLLDA